MIYIYFNIFSDKDIVQDNITTIVRDEYEESLHEKKREKRQRDENVDREKDLYVSYSYIQLFLFMKLNIFMN